MDSALRISADKTVTLVDRQPIFQFHRSTQEIHGDSRMCLPRRYRWRYSASREYISSAPTIVSHPYSRIRRIRDDVWLSMIALRFPASYSDFTPVYSERSRPSDPLISRRHWIIPPILRVTSSVRITPGKRCSPVSLRRETRLVSTGN